MIVSAPLIDRLGFDEYSFNVFLNLALESDNLRDGYTYEQNDLSMVIKSISDDYNVAIRCYHSERGWLSVEFTYKQ